MYTDNRATAASTKSKPGDLSQTLARGLKLLDIVADGREGVSVRDLATAMRLPRSIVQRLLYTLEAEGFLERHPSQVGYRLTMKMWTLGCTAMRRLNLRDAARPYLEELARKTSETVKIGVLDGHDVVYVDGIESPQAVRAYIPIGGRAAVHSIASGKVILAYLSDDRVSELHASLARHSRGKDPLAEPGAFAKELERIRKRGYAINRGERDEGVGAIAAPLFDAEGSAFGSIGIILPVSRLTSAKTLQMGGWASAAAASISAALGYQSRSRRAG